MPSIELKVSNMSCGSCVASVTRALQGVQGVAGVDVDLSSGGVRIEAPNAVDSPAALTAALVAALGAAGYPAVLGCGSSQAKGRGTASKGCCCGP
jgi:copper chaperone CopZ